jgi:hypothetical protein
MPTAGEIKRKYGLSTQDNNDEDIDTSIDVETKSARSRVTNDSLIAEAMDNSGESLRQYGKDMLTPILNPIDTAKSVGELSKSVVSLIKPGEQGNEELARKVGQYYVERYGGLDNIKRTFATDPVGMLGDASLILTVGGAGIKASGKVAQISKVTDPAAKVVGMAGKITDPIYLPSRTALKTADLAGQAARGFSGVASGIGSSPYKTILQGGTEVTQAMRGKTDGAIIVNKAQEGLQQLKDIRRSEYQKGESELFPELQRIEVPIETRTKLSSLVDEYRQTQTTKGGISRIKKGGDVDKVLTEIQKSLDDIPRAVNAEDLSAIKTQIGSIGDSVDFRTQAGAAYTKINKQYSEALKDITPKGFTEFLNTYSRQTADIDDLIRTLSLGNKASTTAAFNKLSRAIREPKSPLGVTLRKLPQATFNELEQLISGFLLSPALPPGLSRSLTAGLVGVGVSGGIFPLQTLAGLGFVSPRLTGEVTKKVGQLRRGAVGAGGLLRTPAQLSRQLESQEQSELRKQGLL